MTKPKVFITRRLPDEIVAPYKEHLDIQMWQSEEEPVGRQMLMEKARSSHGLLTMLTEKIDEKILRQANDLSIVANMAVGYDNVDVKTAENLGIAITHTPDVLTETTADLTFGLLMATARRMIEASQYIKDNKWEHWSPLMLAGTDIHGKTIGIVGMGRIGEAVAKRAKGFGMNILYYNRSRKPEAEESIGASYADFEVLLEQADYVVCLTPLTDQTKHMFNKDAFQKMKKEAFFINASRGATVDEEALYEAIVNKNIAGAGLDVFEQEPISSDHPLLSCPEVVCLPHIGSATKETRYKMMKLSLDNLVNHFQGKPLLTPVP
ncbi:D-glycerate dehydrogenase [Halobacillus sp. Nhm2S1]|uniref:2-hydroxyacid dehydrogenase n=1 Tax=Halobacillus sp. Nhm2S1 TaxID=2866716 RepID=UPI001C72C1CF|nr:D-glycerate dehydrogenase [Halobacillus sp. Nhm2S1]MBX0357372.1 D-glycerate dehydrogenase [Halobacillus sp. Nhm2S1]